MSYCTSSDVARYNLARGSYGATTIPNASQVGLFIAEIAGEIDAQLRKVGYLVPVATLYTSSYEFLRGVNAVGAAWKVEVASPTSDNEGMYQSMYRSAMKMLDSVELDAPKDSSQSMPRSGFGKPGYGPVTGVPSHGFTTTRY